MNRLTLLFLTFFVLSIEGANILAVLPLYIKSHAGFTHPIVKKLAQVGHNVTIITPFEDPEPLPNYVQILADKKNIWADYDASPEEIEMMIQGDLPFVLQEFDRWDGGLWFTETGFESAEVKNFLEHDNTKYDLVMLEYFSQEAYLMFAHKYKAPVVVLCTYGNAQSLSDSMGSPMAMATTPYEFIDFSTPNTLVKRIKNFLFTWINLVGRRLYLMPRQQSLAEKYFDHLPKPLPKLADLERNVSLVFVNTHFSIDVPRATVPGIVELGGTHIKEPSVLPKELKKICDDAKDGIIYFSFGSMVKGSRMPRNRVDRMAKVFSGLKQTVLWKWESDNPPKTAKNVIFSTWLPQDAILNHPNTKVFITHGGLLGIQEAIHFGVPIIGMPFYGDQHLNVDRAVLSGYGLKLLYKDVTEKSLKFVISEILTDPKYSAKAKEISKRFKHRPEPPLETAVYWIEYVLEYRGATHMRSTALDLYWFQRELLDVVAVLIFGSIGAGAAAYCVIKILLKLLLFRKPHKRKSQYLKND